MFAVQLPKVEMPMVELLRSSASPALGKTGLSGRRVLALENDPAELDALRGAERLIRRSHPRLAICVYHRAEHLWEIPLFVRDLGLQYDYFLRSHGHFGFDVVMYAVPRGGR